MPVEKHRYIQPGPDPVIHNWRFVPEDGQSPGRGAPVELVPNLVTGNLECSDAAVEQLCIDSLSVFDPDELEPIPPSQSELDLCVVQNINNCYEAEVERPDLPGWVQLRACNTSNPAVCSEWSNPMPVPESPVDTILWLCILLCFLLNAVADRWLKKR